MKYGWEIRDAVQLCSGNAAYIAWIELSRYEDLKDENKRLRDFVDWLEAGLAGMFSSWEESHKLIEERLIALKAGGEK